jgi:methylmalonyl-CoA/ethylmalonyl-CoA epimerase
MIKKVHHIAIAVPDIEEAARFYERHLGLKMSGVESVPSNKVKAGFIPIGDTRIELVQPETPDSPVARFIDKHGPGFQHLCFEVDDVAAELARLDAAGVRLVNKAPVDGAHGCKVGFIHPAATGGVLIELSQPPDA